MNRELRDLAAAGCPHVQLAGVTRGVHRCNGNNRGRPLSGVLRCKVQHMVEVEAAAAV